MNTSAPLLRARDEEIARLRAAVAELVHAAAALLDDKSTTYAVRAFRLREALRKHGA
jgi:hypothetical protein